MSITKERLIELGVVEETAVTLEAAIKEHFKEYVPYSRFKTVNDEKNTLTQTVKDRDKQLEDLKASTDVEALKTQIADLQKVNKEKDDAHATEVHMLKVETAIIAALTAAKAKNTKAVWALLDIDVEKAKLEDDGTVKGLGDKLKALTEAEDSKFLFDTSGASKPNFKGAKPAETGVEQVDTAVDFSKMSYEELAVYMEENPNAQIPTNNS